MDLTLESGRLIREATEKDILAYIQGEDFAILSTDPNTYIQCAQQKEPPYGYVVEYQHGSLDEHYRAADEPITLDRTLTTFRKYLRGDVSWRTDFRWERDVPGSPQRELEKLDQASSAPETDALFATEVARIKRMAIQRSASTIWIFGAVFIAAILVGLGTWFSAKPINRDDIHGGAALGLGLAALLFGSLLCRFLFPIPRAKCPKCGCDWNIESQNDMQKWLGWHSCPDCGLNIRNG